MPYSVSFKIRFTFSCLTQEAEERHALLSTLQEAFEVFKHVKAIGGDDRMMIAAMKPYLEEELNE